MNNLTFLTEQEILDLEIIKKRGAKAAITDFAILLGGSLSDYYVDGKKTLDGRTGMYWLKNDVKNNCTSVISEIGKKIILDVRSRNVASRLSLAYDDISEIYQNGESTKAKDGVLEVEIGTYPQNTVSKDVQEKLEQLYQDGTLQNTGKVYTTDSRDYDEYQKTFKEHGYIEYEYNEKKFIRVIANARYKEFTLSNGEQYKNGDAIWIEVSPVKWLVDEVARKIITEKLIFAGVQFNKTINGEMTDFENTNIKTFINKYLIKDLLKNCILSSKEKTTPTIYSKEKLLMLQEYIKNGVSPILLKDISAKTFKNAVVLEADCDNYFSSVQGEDIEFAEPKWYNELKNKYPLLVINRLNEISKDEQLKFLELLKYKKVNKFELPEKCVILVTCSNLQENQLAEEIGTLVAQL